MRIHLPSGTAAELVQPVGGAGSCGLVVVPDIMGLRPLCDGIVADLSAANGWSVCAFELYPGQEHLDLEGRHEAAGALGDERVLGDAIAAADATGADTVGILGFCMGGMYVLKAVATGRFDRHCPLYGMVRVPERWHGVGQGEPLDALSQGDASSVLAIIGCDDPYTPPGDVDDLEVTGATVVRYEDAGHGFVHDPSRPSHRAADAADAWKQVLEWLGP
ncbi:MAG: dienelactone hydrolase family protein [Acidimicrobiales bacterium]|nr:dienelactone hydrolase family protein [Acidimicrobiales bacterium]